MSAKAKQLIVIYTAAALVTLSVLSAVLYSKLADYRLTALYSSSGAFETTVSAVDRAEPLAQKEPVRHRCDLGAQHMHSGLRQRARRRGRALGAAVFNAGA